MDRSLELLFGKVKEAYERSDIRANFPQESWNYSITSTYLKKKVPLILGFNWGARHGVEYQPQEIEDIPDFSFGEVDDLGSLNRSLKFFECYYPEGLNGVQCNFVPFRSRAENQIGKNDMDLSKRFFLDLVGILSPSIIISFSSRLRNYLEKSSKDKDGMALEDRDYLERPKGMPVVLKGNLIIEGRNEPLPFRYIPHPNSRVKSEYREAAWKFAFDTPK